MLDIDPSFLVCLFLLCNRFQEFLEQTRKQEFEQDPGWNTIDEQPVYTHEEYQAFERQRQMEIQRMIDQGLVRFAADRCLSFLY